MKVNAQTAQKTVLHTFYNKRKTFQCKFNEQIAHTQAEKATKKIEYNLHKQEAAISQQYHLLPRRQQESCLRNHKQNRQDITLSE